MDNKEVKRISRDLFADWEKGIERATDDAARTDDLSQEQLNHVAGMQIESGLRGGIWGHTENNTCTCTQCI